MSGVKADRPTTHSGKQYHLETGAGDLAPRCLLVGSPERAQLIADTFFLDAVKLAATVVSSRSLVHTMAYLSRLSPLAWVVLPLASSFQKLFAAVDVCSSA